MTLNSNPSRCASTATYFRRYPSHAWTASEENVYWGSRLVAKRIGVGPMGHFITDRLHSKGDGSAFYPYGESKTGAAGDDREQFATYTRDQSSGLDYADQRWYSSRLGRFTSVDPAPWYRNGSVYFPGAYVYALNEPTNTIDPKGLYPVHTTIQICIERDVSFNKNGVLEVIHQRACSTVVLGVDQPEAIIERGHPVAETLIEECKNNAFAMASQTVLTLSQLRADYLKNVTQVAVATVASGARLGWEKGKIGGVIAGVLIATNLAWYTAAKAMDAYDKQTYLPQVLANQKILDNQMVQCENNWKELAGLQ